MDHTSGGNAIVAYLGNVDSLFRRGVQGTHLLEIVDDRNMVDAAYAHRYDDLAREFQAILQTRAHLAEIGCGKGQLTIPLANLRPKSRLEVVDTFAGPYSGSLRQLRKSLLRERLRQRVKVHKIDYLHWLTHEFADKYGAVISSEFLPEIDSHELRMFLSECYRVIRRGGRTIHSYLSPTPRNRRQALLIEADSEPAWTKTPPKEWFSPKPSLVTSELRRVGFRNIRAATVRSNLIIRSSAAKDLLKTWDVKSSFCRKYQHRLEKDGLEIPDWVIVSGSKS